MWELAAVIMILAVAAELRLVELASVPSGVSPDESTAGLEARRILDEGWIGPYSPHAAGQPTGVLYAMAASVRLFGETVFSLRLVSALAGIATVLTLYIVLRRNLGVWPAVVGGAFLAVMSWHVHFGRFAVPVGTWPFAVVATTLLIIEGTRRGGFGWWAASGAVAGLGIYMYDAHTVVLLVLGLFLAIYFRRGSAFPVRRRIAQVAVLGLALAVVALPMIDFAADPRNGYFQHARYASIFNKPEWRALGGPDEKAAFLARRYLGYWDRVCCHPEPDGVDGTGATALVPPSLLLLAGTGLVLGLLRRRGALVTLGASVLLLMPAASVVTEGGLARRTLVLTPFIAMFGAIAVVELIRIARARGPWILRLTGLGLALLVGFVLLRNVDYIRQFPGSDQEKFTFAWAVTDASRFMDRLQPGTHVYFYSSVVSFDFEVRRFLAPVASGEDRSSEFGRVSFAMDSGRELAAFVFLDAYLDRLGEVRRRYPGGQTVFGRGAANPTFIAYVPPSR